MNLPPLSILEPAPVVDVEPFEADAHAVLAALTGAGIDVVDVTAKIAPQLVRYDVELQPGTDPKKVERAVDIVALAVGQKVRYAGVHGGHVGIEVNRDTLAPVGLRETIEAGEALVGLGMPLGYGVHGKPLNISLARMPHLLVAGTTGSGKSVWLTSALTSLLLRNTPDDMRMLLIDPKHVELAAFEGLPHLMGPIVTEMSHVGIELRRLVDMMEQRFALFKAAGVKDLTEYNDDVVDGARLPRVVGVIDELADLLMQTKAAEPLLVRLLQKGRAAGIHWILATQRPEAKVFTGLIRSNVPARVVFAVQSQVDARVAMDVSGAEKLRGQGDGLFKAPGVGEPQRFQAPMVSAADVARVVNYWKRSQGKVDIIEPPTVAPSLHEQAVEAEQAAERAALDAWMASEHAPQPTTIEPAVILAEAGLTPEVIDALVEVSADRIAELVAEKVNAMVLSGPNSGGE